MPSEIRQFRRMRFIEDAICDRLVKGEVLRDLVNERTEEYGETPISMSQLRKDIKKMQTSRGILINSFRGANPGYIYAENSPRLQEDDLASLTKPEKEELIFAFEMLQSKTSLPLMKGSLTVINRIINRQLAETARNIIMTEPSDTGVLDDRIFSLIYGAIRNRKSVIIEYLKLKETRPSIRTFSPYLIREYRGFWYVVGHDHGKEEDKAVIILALDRIRDVRTANVTYHINLNFDAESYFKHSLGVWHETNADPVEIGFWASETAAHFFEVRKFHPSQSKVSRMECNGKPGYLYKMKVFVSDEVVNLFMERGGNIKALNPPEFVEKVKRQLSLINDLYKK